MNIFKWLTTFLIVIIASLGGFLYYSFNIEPYQVEVVEYVSVKDKEAEDEIKVVQFSDVHIKEDFTHENLEEAVNKINDQKPDFVVFTGDLYDNYSIFAVISSMTIILATVIIIFLVRRIVEPLNKFDLFAKNMGKGEFIPLEVETNDELEKVADTLNQMGTEIVHYQEQLKEKNLQMEELLNNVAHDLKTPISLIKLYSEGIKDGLDDGTFLQTIVKESNEMNQMVERLLFISKIEKEEIELREINLSSFVKNRLDTYLIMSKEQEIEIVSRIEDGLLIETNERLLQSIIDNLISNALKYTSWNQIFINLNSVDQKIVFEISNELSDSNLEVEKIWEPYYVGEKSRSKELSGTGLGLYLVKKIVDKLDYEIDCRIKEDKLYFTLMINQ